MYICPQICCIAQAVAMSPIQESSIRMGISYTPAFRVLLAGREYIIPLELHTSDIQVPLICARNITAELGWNISHMNASYAVVSSLKKSLSNFNEGFNKLFIDMNEFLKYIIETAYPLRKKCGAFNLLGSTSNVLFSTATQAQVDAIHGRLQKAEAMTEKEITMLNFHSTTLNITIREIRSLNSAISRLELASAMSHKIIRQFSLRTLALEGE